MARRGGGGGRPCVKVLECGNYLKRGRVRGGGGLLRKPNGTQRLGSADLIQSMPFVNPNSSDGQLTT